jgi:hypothetical protein
MDAKLAPQEATANRISSPIAILSRIWPPAVLILGSLLTAMWSAFLIYVIARLVMRAF